jgi:hypothetical protein
LATNFREPHILSKSLTELLQGFFSTFSDGGEFTVKQVDHQYFEFYFDLLKGGKTLGAIWYDSPEEVTLFLGVYLTLKKVRTKESIP